MNNRVAIYARYSSDLQNKASIEDQIALCNEKAQSENWIISGCFTDAATSGASLIRSGIQGLMQMASAGQFDIVLAEAMDRLSRDQADIAAIFKRLEFAGIRVITLAEGELSTMHIGLKGTMNQLFLKDLADKTRRGLRGRIEKGFSGGGKAFGYSIVKDFNDAGDPIRGKREVNASEAETVERIFISYVDRNQSPKSIAAELNSEGILGPNGNPWSQSTINGNRRRGTGVLNNEIYIGNLVWNRLTYLKCPETGKRQSRLNDPSQWIIKDVPELRIVSDDLWNSVKEKQKSLDAHGSSIRNKVRPQYLLSGLLECGCCGGGMSKVNQERYGCSSARNKGKSVCANVSTIKREILEERVLNGLEQHLMRDDLVEAFCNEYVKHLSQLRKRFNTEKMEQQKELQSLEKEKKNLLTAIKNGIPADVVKDELVLVSQRIDVLKIKNESFNENLKPLIHPTLAKRYREQVSNLRELVLTGNASAEVRVHIRSLIEKIKITPKEDGSMKIDLYGDLAGILSIAKNEKRVNNEIINPSVKVVAGAGFEPTTFGL